MISKKDAKNKKPAAGAAPASLSKRARKAIAALETAQQYPRSNGGYEAYSGRVSAQLRNRDLGNYLGMLASPFQRQLATRYPDETLTPTGLVHLASSITFNQEGTKPFATFLSQKLVLEQQGLTPTSITVGTINVPVQWGVGNQPAQMLGPATDYGASQKQYVTLSVADRTLAYAIRARVTGLPPSTFLPSGTLYFLQLQAHDLSTANTGGTSATGTPAVGLSTLEDIGLNGEGACIRAVEAGKGFSVTVNELSRNEGLHIPYLPQGPMSYVFSDTDAVTARAGFGTFPAYQQGEAPAMAAMLSAQVSAPTFLAIVGFGLQDGMQLRFDYVHHAEYIPSSGAAGLVHTETRAPSTLLRESIATESAALSRAITGQTSHAVVESTLTKFVKNMVGAANTAKAAYDSAAPLVGAAMRAFGGSKVAMLY